MNPTDAATRATYAAFIGAGFAFASWASRIPQVKAHLGLDPSQLGAVLLAIAAGSVISLPLSGPVVARFGSRRTVALAAALGGVGLAVVAVGYRIGVAPVVGGLFIFGIGNGGWDVGMNVQGATVERRRGRAIMARFHAGFSIGTVAGAFGGAAMVALGVSVTAHLLGVAVLIGLVVPVMVQRFVADTDQGAPLGKESARSSLSAWGERRTLLVGLFVLAFAFAEGVGNDWISLAAIDRLAVAPAVGTLAFATFLGAMTAGRWLGPGLLDAHGRVPVVRVQAVVAVAGLMLFVFGPGVPAAFAGAVLWGVGASLGFPVGMSAGADDPARAAPRVSVVTTIGYCAFLGGPPLIGFLAVQLTVPHALTAVVVLLVVAFAIAGNVAPRADLNDRDAESAGKRAARVG